MDNQNYFLPAGNVYVYDKTFDPRFLLQNMLQCFFLALCVNLRVLSARQTGAQNGVDKSARSLQVKHWSHVSIWDTLRTTIEIKSDSHI